MIIGSQCMYKMFLRDFVIITEQGRLGIWALDGDPNHTGLLRYALTEQNFEHTLVMLVASMAQPWSILDSLEKWVSVLQQHVDRLKLLPEDRRDYEQSCEYQFTTEIFPHLLTHRAPDKRRF